MTPDPVTSYRETQFFALWVYAVLAGVTTLMWSIAATLPYPASIVFVFAGLAITILSLALILGMLQMITEIAGDDLLVRFGRFSMYRRVVPIGTVREVEVVDYNPLADFGGWGIRLGRGVTALSARGTRGVQLHLADGSRLLIGSQQPEALAGSIRSRMLPDPAG